MSKNESERPESTGSERFNFCCYVLGCSLIAAGAAMVLGPGGWLMGTGMGIALVPWVRL